MYGLLSLHILQVLALGAPFPMVVLPVDGEFWMEGTYHVLSRDMNDRPIYPSIDMSRCTINEDNNSVLEYRKHFAGRVRMVCYIPECRRSFPNFAFNINPAV